MARAGAINLGGVNVGRWKPPAGRNPYEDMGRGRKMQRPTSQEIRTCERAVDSVQGCGDTSCPICMPARGEGGGAKSGSAGDYFTVYADFTLGSMMRSMRMPNDMMSSSQASRAEQAARQARAKVEKYLLKTEHTVAWEDVVGNEAARTALIEAVEAPTKNAALLDHYGARPPRGALLFGPPGCGKTMFAKAASSVLRALHGGACGELLVINGPQIQSPYVGVTEEIIRDVFTYARAYKALHRRPLVIFVDECDAILPCRDGSGTGRRALPWEESNVATFLTEMDGMEDSGAFVLLATNRPDAIDPALLRDGRCDRRIKVERPGPREATQIMVSLLARVPLAHDGEHDADRRQALAETWVAALFAKERSIATVVHSQGSSVLTLGAMISGASVTGLVERAKGIAMRRDLAAGGSPTGLTVADAMAAVDEVLREARAMPVPTLPVMELGERLGVEIHEVRPWTVARKAISDDEIAATLAEAA